MKPRILLASIAALLAAPSLHAQTWDGGGVAGGALDWITSTNWNPNIAPLNDGTANIIFAGLIDNNPGPNLDQNWDVNSVVFNNTAGAFVLGSTGGFTLTVEGGGITNNDTQTQAIAHSVALGAPQTWNASSGGLTFSGASVANGGNLLTIAGANPVTVSSAISGTGGLTKNGTGTTTLSGATANTFTGLTQINTGVLTLQKSIGVNALAGSVIVGDGIGTDELRLGASNQIPLGVAVTVASSGLFNLTGFTETIQTLFVDGGNTSIGTGSLSVGTSVQMTGGTISSTTGSFILLAPLTTNAAAVSATISGTMLLNGQRVFTVADGAAQIDLDVSSFIQTGSIVKEGAGALRLSGANLMNATSELNAGSVLIGNNLAFGVSVLELNAGRLQPDGAARTLANSVNLNGDITVGGTFSLGLAGTFTINANSSLIVEDPAQTVVLSGTLAQGAAGLTFSKDGIGSLRIQGVAAPTFSGLTSHKSGTMFLDSLNNSIGGDFLIGDEAGAGSDLVRLDASNQIADTANVEVRNTGTLFLNAFSETIGSLTLKGGTVSGGTGLTVNGPITTIAEAQPALISASLNLGAGIRTFNIANGSAVVDLDVTGSVQNGAITKIGAGTLRLSSPSTYAGGTLIQSGTVLVGNDTALGTGTITLSNATLSADGGSRVLANASTLSNSVVLGGTSPLTLAGPVTILGTTEISVPAGTVTISGSISGAATSFNKNGIGTLILSGSTGNTTPAPFQVDEGLVVLNKSSGPAIQTFLSIVQNFIGLPSVRLDGNNQILDIAGVSVGSGGTLDLNGFNDTITTFNVTGGTVVTGSGTLTVIGPISSGLTGTAGTVLGNLNLGGGTRSTSIANGSAAIDLNVGATITNGSLLKDGPGTLAITGAVANAFTQPLIVHEGVLRLGKTIANAAINVPLTIGDGGAANSDIVRLDGSEQIANTVPVSIATSGLLDLNNFNETLGSLALTGGNVSTGTGVLGFDANPAVISSSASASPAGISGNLSLGGIARSFSVADGGATIDLDISAAIFNGGPATGFEKNGAGVLRLSGNNTFSGGLILNGGTLSIGSANALNTSTLFLQSGTVQADGVARTIGPVDVTGSGFVDGAPNLTFGGSLLLGSGKSLTKNGTGTLTLSNAIADFSGALTLNAGTLAAGAQTIQPIGLLTQNGGTFTGALTNLGTFTFNGGTFSGSLTNHGTVNFNANFNAANGLSNTAAFTVGSGITVSASAPGIDNTGIITLTNGTLAGVGAIVNQNLITGFGAISGSGGFTNNGFLTINGGNFIIGNTGTNANPGQIDVPISRLLRLDNSLQNTGTITLASTIQGLGTLTNQAGGIIRGRGTISAPLANLGGTLRAENGTLTVTTAFNNTGIVRADDGATLILNGSLTNQPGGLITLFGTLSGASPLNNSAGARIDFRNGTGLLAGSGSVNNFGLISGDGTVARFLSNNASGEVRAESGRTLVFNGGFGANAGTLALQGGALDFSGALTNSAGALISGRGSLTAPSIINNGVMAFSGGNADIHGDTTNGAGARIVTSGAGSVTTFFDDVMHNGLEIFTGAGASTVFFGAQSGAGSFTGTGTVYFIGDLRPGNSPASVLFEGDLVLGGSSSLTLELGGLGLGSQYDHLNVGGSLHADGDLVLALLGGFTPQFGDTFDLFDAGTFSGNFDSIIAPALGGGNEWDFSALKTTGTVTVVPEPGVGALLASALGLLGLRRRRSEKVAQLSHFSAP